MLSSGETLHSHAVQARWYPNPPMLSTGAPLFGIHGFRRRRAKIPHAQGANAILGSAGQPDHTVMGRIKEGHWLPAERLGIAPERADPSHMGTPRSHPSSLTALPSLIPPRLLCLHAPSRCAKARRAIARAAKRCGGVSRCVGEAPAHSRSSRGSGNVVACSTVPASAYPTIRLFGAPCGMLRVGPDRDTGSRVAVPVQRVRFIRPVWKVRAICERL